jgi:hypothetical protein
MLDLGNPPRHSSVMSVLPPPPPIPLALHVTEQVGFDRRELAAILQVYGRMVAMGEWRDYAIASLRDAAVFSVFRRTAEVPLYRIEKRPRLRARQGMYAVIAAEGHVLRRGHDLATVLRLFDRKMIRAVD